MKYGDEKLWNYNALDCVNTFEIFEAQQKAIDQLGLRESNDFQTSLFYPVLWTMNKGIRVDERLRGEMVDNLQAAEAAAYRWLEEAIGHPLNIKSPKQVSEFFYSEMGQGAYHNRKTGGVTTDDETLEKIATREPLLRPIVDRISLLRSIGVFTGTFLKPLCDPDGRLRCSFNIGGTVTFRFSSSENVWGTGTNLQNISKGDEALGLPNLRRIFIPDPGMTFFDIDLSAADLRVVVWESDCKEMKQMFAAGLDPYTEIAKEYYNDPTISKKDPRRQQFKSFAHATNYLGKAKNIATRVGLSVLAAERTQAWYLNRFPEIASWQSRFIQSLTATSRIRNAFGYTRTIFDRIDGNVFNEAAAWIPQSTVAIIINHAYKNIFLNLPQVDVLLQVHDSLAGQFPSSRPDLAEAILQEASIVVPYPDPLIIPVGIKLSDKSWGDCG